MVSINSCVVIHTWNLTQYTYFDVDMNSFNYLKENKVGSAASFPAAAGQSVQQTAVDDLLGLVSEITAIQVLAFFQQSREYIKL